MSLNVKDYIRTIADFPWGKSMRWGSGRMNWVRPLRAITATFGTDNDEPQVIAYHGYLSGEHAPGRKEPRTFVRVADAALYDAKRLGRNRVSA